MSLHWNTSGRSHLKDATGTGWLPPLPDLRDYTTEHSEIAPMAKKLGWSEEVTDAVLKMKSESQEDQLDFGWLPPKKDLRKYCSPIENQGVLGSCTAHAAMGIVEYFQKRAYKKHIDGSRLFVYKATRNLLGWTGDTGAYTRTTMGALVLCGCPPEKYWTYTDQDPDFDEEPPAFVYALADNYEAIRYFVHDPISQNKTPKQILSSVKIYLAFGIPSMFGFFGFEVGHYEGNIYVMPYNKGEIYYPCKGDKAHWGHAIVAVGYDNNKEITNPNCEETTKGAFLIRNSWGTGWGNKGYGWLPYAFVEKGLAWDFWSLLSAEWVDTGNFGI